MVLPRQRGNGHGGRAARRGGLGAGPHRRRVAQRRRGRLPGHGRRPAVLRLADAGGQGRHGERRPGVPGRERGHRDRGLPAALGQGQRRTPGTARRSGRPRGDGPGRRRRGRGRCQGRRHRPTGYPRRRDHRRPGRRTVHPRALRSRRTRCHPGHPPHRAAAAEGGRATPRRGAHVRRDGTGLLRARQHGHRPRPPTRRQRRGTAGRLQPGQDPARGQRRLLRGLDAATGADGTTGTFTPKGGAA